MEKGPHTNNLFRKIGPPREKLYDRSDSVTQKITNRKEGRKELVYSI